MATVIVFDPISKNTQQISVTLESAIVDTDGDARVDYFIQLSTGARKISGSEITPRIIRRKTNLVRGSTQHDGITSTPYETMSKAIEDYILNMVEGNGGSDAMGFNI